MSLFNRTEPAVAESEITGTAAMRELLKQRSRKWNIANIARDINDNLARDSKRAAVGDIARRIAGDAGDSVAASIAKSLVGNLPADVGREAGVSAADLEDFIDGKTDLKPEFKAQLAAILYPSSNVSFDPARDCLVDAGPPSTKLGTLPDPWVNPNQDIAKALAAYHAALARANPPPPPRTKPLDPGATKIKRPGFA